jgi:hypothetical protein
MLSSAIEMECGKFWRVASISSLPTGAPSPHFPAWGHLRIVPGLQGLLHLKKCLLEVQPTSLILECAVLGVLPMLLGFPTLSGEWEVNGLASAIRQQDVCILQGHMLQICLGMRAQ